MLTSTGLENSFLSSNLYLPALMRSTCSKLYAQRMQAMLYYVYEEGHPPSQFLVYEAKLLAELTQRDTFTWPAHPTSAPKKTKDSLGIESLHNVYLDSEQATDLACHQEFEGFHLPGISTEITTIPWQKIIVHPFSVALKCSLSYHHPE